MPIPGYLCGSISIHAPRMGSDKHFLHACAVVAHISIHAPRMGSDNIARAANLDEDSFQSTLPHGERLLSLSTFGISVKFQSTLPHGERLHWRKISYTDNIISIHAPAWGATSTFGASAGGSYEFQSTLPHGERQQKHEISSLFL